MVDPGEARTGSRAVKRFGQMIGLERARLAEYERYHAKIWPEIEHAIREAGIRNYSIFHRDGQLFGYYEYVGPEGEYAARMEALARAPRMREWWDLMESMQIPVPGRAPGEWWAEMKEVFHQD
jgi:L-rhamnose mutarotase